MATPAETPTPANLALDHQLCFALCRAARSITRCYARRLESLGLNYTQYLVLLALWENDGPSARTLANRVRLDPSSLTPLLGQLEARRLVERRRPPDNQRRVNVRLTEAGWQLRHCAAEVQRDVAGACGLAPHEMATLRDQLHALADTLEVDEANTFDAA